MIPWIYDWRKTAGCKTSTFSKYISIFSAIKIVIECFRSFLHLYTKRSESWKSPCTASIIGRRLKNQTLMLAATSKRLVLQNYLAQIYFLKNTLPACRRCRLRSFNCLNVSLDKLNPIAWSWTTIYCPTKFKDTYNMTLRYNKTFISLY